MCSSANTTGEEQKEGEENGSAVAKGIFSSVHVNESYGRTTEINKEPKNIFQPKGDQRREDDHTCLSRKETTSVDSQ